MAVNPIMKKHELPFYIKVPAETAVGSGIANVTAKMPKETRNRMIVKDNKIAMETYVNGYMVECTNIMPDIVDVKTYKRPGTDDVGAVAVKFSDGTITRATVSIGDVYSLEQGLSVCITKRLLYDRIGRHSSSVYNKIVRHALKVKKANDQYALKVVEEQEAIDARMKRLAEKKRQRDERRANEKREAEIELRKEAYLRAMRVFQEEQMKMDEQRKVEEQKVVEGQKE